MSEHDVLERAAFHSIDAATGTPSGPAFATDDGAAVAAACAAAEATFDVYRATGTEDRARFLEAIGDQIVATGDDLIAPHGDARKRPATRAAGG